MNDYLEINPMGPEKEPAGEMPAAPAPKERQTPPVQEVQTFTAASTLPVQPEAPAQPAEPQPVQETVTVQEVPVEHTTYTQPENNCTYHQTGAAGSYGSQEQPQTNYYDPQVHQNYGQQPQAQPGGYDQSAYNYGYAPRQTQPKKKMKTGAKVFLWVLLVCAVLSVTALVSVGVYTLVTGTGGETTGEVSGVNSVPPTNSLPGTPVTPPSSSESSGGVSSEVIDLTPNSGIQINTKPAGQPLSAQEAYNRVVNSTVLVKVSFVDANGNQGEGTGSGVIATEDGYIITNSHVVQDSRNVNVQIITYDGSEYSGMVVGYDRTTDLAIVKINASGLQPATFGAAAEMGVGEQVITIGNPGGEDFSFSMTGGYISGLNRHVGSYSSAGMTYIQTDAAINPGNSGGALVNLYGQVVGINSSKIVADEYEGMGFAIPVDKAQTIIGDLMSGGYVTGRVRLGISGRDVTDAQVYNYGVPYGFIIVNVDEDSSFAGSGVQAGDIITAVDGEEVRNLTQLSNKLLEYAPGDTVTVTLYRLTTSLVENTYAGQYFNIEIVLLADNGETQVN